jgi:hypothetical protein
MTTPEFTMVTRKKRVAVYNEDETEEFQDEDEYQATTALKQQRSKTTKHTVKTEASDRDHDGGGKSDTFVAKRIKTVWLSSASWNDVRQFGSHFMMSKGA